jgi:hypothetical protein
MLTEAV